MSGSSRRDRGGRWILTMAIACSLACGGSDGGKSAKPSPAPPGQPVAQAITSSIGAQGGTFSTRDGRLTVHVPAGAVAASSVFTVQEVTNTAPRGIGSAYQLQPAGTTFRAPIAISFSTRSVETPIEKLGIAFQDDTGYWAPVVTVLRNRDARVITATSRHFSGWALVTTDPSLDLAGTFTVTSTLDVVPVTATGLASLGYAGEDATERYYLLSGATTLQPTTYQGNACTPQPLSGLPQPPPDPAVYPFPTNLAEVFKAPRTAPNGQNNQFWWGTSARWDLVCGSASLPVVAMAFDTLGINYLGCDRGYTPAAPAPLFGSAELKGDYTIDCASKGGGSVRASWDFVQCGGTCTPADSCAGATGTWDCTASPAVCRASTSGALAAGTPCTTSTGAAGACSGTGACVACQQDAPCTPGECATRATIECSSGAPVCTDRDFKAAGTSCTVAGSPGVCSASSLTTVPITPSTCNACVQDAPCTPSECATRATVECSSGAPVCTDREFKAAGTPCGTTANPGTCSPSSLTTVPITPSVCSACTQDAACTPSECATRATIECSSGAPVCTDREFKTAGSPCSIGVCSPSSLTTVPITPSTCVACAAGSCSSTNVCATAASTVCSSGAPVCTDTAFQPDATACDPGAIGSSVCLAGSCAVCTAGAGCIPSGTGSDPCHVGSVQCGQPAVDTTPAVPPACVDTGATALDGSLCDLATGNVCVSGTCGACVPGAPCITATCNAGILSCSGATSTCLDQGTAAACPVAGQVCTAGICR